MALLTVVGAVTGGGDEQLGWHKALQVLSKLQGCGEFPDKQRTKFVLRSLSGIPKAAQPECALADSCVALPAGCLRTEAYIFLNNST